MRILVVELEPTHYKADLWNAVVGVLGARVVVIYTERKNWSPDGGHDYQRFPTGYFSSVTFSGKGLSGALLSSYRVVARIFIDRPDLVFIAGYVHVQTILAILFSRLMRRPFVVHADVFNNARPVGRFWFVKLLIREIVRSIIFRNALAVLVCGVRGVTSAHLAGCERKKIVNFPYTISSERINNDAPLDVPDQCRNDLKDEKTIIFFSGRMIERKGLVSLLQALAMLDRGLGWTVWLEGAGPELDRMKDLAIELSIADRCRFLGFCQYDVHSWLLRSSSVVVVPSLFDSWGIVVDEALQLGKAVIATNTTGSAVDRIVHGVNGYITNAGDVDDLHELLAKLLKDPDLREQMGFNAKNSSRTIKPEDNARTLEELLSR